VEDTCARWATSGTTDLPSPAREVRIPRDRPPIADRDRADARPRVAARKALPQALSRARSGAHDYMPVVLLAASPWFRALTWACRGCWQARHENRDKDLPFECGMLPLEDIGAGASVKFYVVAMLFILFDVRFVFLYPGPSATSNWPVRLRGDAGVLACSPWAGVRGGQGRVTGRRGAGPRPERSSSHERVPRAAGEEGGATATSSWWCRDADATGLNERRLLRHAVSTVDWRARTACALPLGLSCCAIEFMARPRASSTCALRRRGRALLARQSGRADRRRYLHLQDGRGQPPRVRQMAEPSGHRMGACAAAAHVTVYSVQASTRSCRDFTSLAARRRPRERATPDELQQNLRRTGRLVRERHGSPTGAVPPDLFATALAAGVRDAIHGGNVLS